jgi:hypothetical protein
LNSQEVLDFPAVEVFPPVHLAHHALVPWTLFLLDAEYNFMDFAAVTPAGTILAKGAVRY